MKKYCDGEGAEANDSISTSFCRYVFIPPGCRESAVQLPPHRTCTLFVFLMIQPNRKTDRKGTHCHLNQRRTVQQAAQRYARTQSPPTQHLQTKSRKSIKRNKTQFVEPVERAIYGVRSNLYRTSTSIVFGAARPSQPHGHPFKLVPKFNEYVTRCCSTL